MKNIIINLSIFLIIIFSFLIVNYSFSQQGWFNLNTSFGGGGIYFRDINNGIIAEYKTTNAGLSWNYMGYISGGFSVTFPNQNTGFGVSNIYISKTTNFGNNWTYKENPTNQNLFSVFFPNSNTGYACGDYSIIKTTNSGTNWIILTPPFPWYYYGIFFTDSITGYAAGSKIDTSVILKTTNGGISWSSQLFQANNYGRFYSLFFTNANTGFIGGTLQIFKTTNAGINWFTLFPPTQNTINSIYFPSASIGYGACYGGQIIKTTNGGDNWFIQTTGTGSNLNSIFFVNDLTGYACGDNNTVLKTTDGGGPPIGIKPISEDLPKNFKLFQNYPNPFNPSTVIKFQVASFRLVSLVIYDALGKDVSELVNTELQPGIYEVVWNASNFSSGFYFYRIEAGDYSETKRMVLLK